MGALGGYEGGRERMDGEAPGATLGRGGGREDRQLGVEEAARGGGGGGGPSGLSQLAGKTEGSRWTGGGGGG